MNQPRSRPICNGPAAARPPVPPPPTRRPLTACRPIPSKPSRACWAASCSRPTIAWASASRNSRPGRKSFYDLRHQTIFQTLTEMYDEQAGHRCHHPPATAEGPPAVGERRRPRLLFRPAGRGAVRGQPGQYYLDIVLEKYLLRKMIQTCTAIVGRVFDYEGEVDALLDEVERDILRISEERVGGASLGIKELVNRPSPRSRNITRTRGCSPASPPGSPISTK